mmetsp:Transcript_120685/g.276597  ORF Transcript_120685/g.276597 Transcript_120685/m.276597 type:complete len:426 (-) Transcript_120685:71-1348(-)
MPLMRAEMEAELGNPLLMLMTGVMGPFSAMREMCFCAFIFGMFAALSRSKFCCCCGKRGCDLRAFSCIRDLYLKHGIDKFPTFDVIVRVHSVKDTVRAPKDLRVKVQFKYNSWTTKVSPGKWEQTSKVEVPQGATECVLSLTSGSGKRVGSAKLDVWEEMLEKEGFFGETQNIKLLKAGQAAGTLRVTFLKGGESGEEEKAPLLAGMKDTSYGLNAAVQQHLGDAGERTEPIEGEEKIRLLAKTLQGRLIKTTGGKEFFFAVVEMDTPKGDSDGEGGKKKWYWCWYKDQKMFKTDAQKPVGHIPILAITSVRREPKNETKFVIKYEHKGMKAEMPLKRVDRETEIWSEGLELLVKETHKLKKLAKASAKPEPWESLSVEQQMVAWREYWQVEALRMAEAGQPQDEIQKWLAEQEAQVKSQLKQGP